MWSGPVHRQPQGNFSLVLPREDVVGQPLEVRLVGVGADGGETELATYRLRLAAE